MLSFLPGPVKGLIAATLFALNTIFWCGFIFALIPLKFLIPVPGIRRAISQAMVAIGENWISCNSLEIGLIEKIRWDVSYHLGENETPEKNTLSRDHSYLISANHQSWVDIVILQTVFNRRIPFLRFFLKKELLYVPILGLAWWALDFPFMKRYSKAYLEKHPEKRGKDMETTRRACEKFQGSRISVLNFLEGTRFTPEKHARQNSAFNNLLTPKTGGLAFVLEAMGEQFEALLDVTIVYPSGAISMWNLFSGRIHQITVRIDKIDIPKAFLGGNYLEDPVFREDMQQWVRTIWKHKDEVMQSVKNGQLKA
jgi:1-acyl-sn-glycerol-3-phosphate acyltransferase